MDTLVTCNPLAEMPIARVKESTQVASDGGTSISEAQIADSGISSSLSTSWSRTLRTSGEFSQFLSSPRER